MFYIAAYLILTFICLFLAPKGSFYRRYSEGVWIGIDQTINAALLGNEDHTISGRAGRGRRRGSKFWRITANIIDWLFGDKNHCIDSIEQDEKRINYGYPVAMLLIYGASGVFSVFVIGQLLKLI